MKKRIVISFLLALCMIFACGCELVKSPEYYELKGGDEVSSFTKVVGSRSVGGKKVNMTNAVQSISYTYKDVENAYTDAETYVHYLIDDENFKYSGMLNMDETEDEILISKTSPSDSEFEIRIIVKYDTKTNSVQVTAEREKIIK